MSPRGHLPLRLGAAVLLTGALVAPVTAATVPSAHAAAPVELSSGVCSAPTLSVSPATATVGDTVTLLGACTGGERATFLIDGASVGTAQPDATGDVRLSVRVEKAGELQVQMNVNGRQAFATLTVTEAAPKDPAPSEPAPEEPTDPAPSDPAPEEPTEPAPSDPTDPAPADPAPKDPAPKDPAPKDPAPKDPAPKEPAPKDPAPKDPAPKDPAPKDPAPEQDGSTDTPSQDSPDDDEGSTTDDRASDVATGSGGTPGDDQSGSTPADPGREPSGSQSAGSGPTVRLSGDTLTSPVGSQASAPEAPRSDLAATGVEAGRITVLGVLAVLTGGLAAASAAVRRRA